MHTQQTKRLRRWFRAAVFVGAALALIVLVNSISNYAFISRRVAIEQIRREIARAAVAVDARLHQERKVDQEQLQRIVEDVRSASGSVAWIEVRTRDRKLAARSGMTAPAFFSDQHIRNLLRNRQPVTTTKSFDGEEAVVDLLPMRLAGAPAQIEIAMLVGWRKCHLVAPAPELHHQLVGGCGAPGLSCCNGAEVPLVGTRPRTRKRA